MTAIAGPDESVSPGWSSDDESSVAAPPPSHVNLQADSTVVGQAAVFYGSMYKGDAAHTLARATPPAVSLHEASGSVEVHVDAAVPANASVTPVAVTPDAHGPEDDDEEDDADDDPSSTVVTAVAAPPKKPPRKKRVVVNLSRCRYDILREVVEEDMGWKVDRDDENLAEFLTKSVSVAKPPGEKVWSPAGGAGKAAKAEHDASDAVALLQAMLQSERNQIVWSDVSVMLQTVSKLRHWQRVNHFPSMNVICRKVLLCQQLGRMERLFPEHFNFFPQSFSVRSDMRQLTDYCRATRNRKTFIVKPNAGCQGIGIVLTKNPVKLIPNLPHDDYVCQVYVARPLLIERKKFDMRLYVLVLSVAPLKILLHNEGLIRMCTTDYVKPTTRNMGEGTMHLTNYAVNKKSEAFTFGKGTSLSEGTPASGVEDEQSSEDESAATEALPVPLTTSVRVPCDRFADDGDGSAGFKRDFQFFNKFAESAFAGVCSVPALWRRIEKAIVLTILSAYHQLRHAYAAANPVGIKSSDCRTCFELLGFDVLLDRDGQPYVLEVNHSPSFGCDSAIDHRIKKKVLSDVMRHLQPHMVDVKRASDHQYRKLVASKKHPLPELNVATGFRVIFPANYAKYNVVAPFQSTCTPVSHEAALRYEAQVKSAADDGVDPVEAEQADMELEEPGIPETRAQLQAIYEEVLAGTQQVVPGQATRRVAPPTKPVAAVGDPSSRPLGSLKKSPPPLLRPPGERLPAGGTPASPAVAGSATALVKARRTPPSAE